MLVNDAEQRKDREVLPLCSHSFTHSFASKTVPEPLLGIWHSLGHGDIDMDSRLRGGACWHSWEACHQGEPGRTWLERKRGPLLTVEVVAICLGTPPKMLGSQECSRGLQQSFFTLLTGTRKPGLCV